MKEIIDVKYISPVWIHNFKLVAKYLKHYNVEIMPYSFKTKDGITEDPNGKDLGYWYAQNRQAAINFLKGKPTSIEMTHTHIRLLKMLGPLDYTEYHWNKYYEIAKAIYDHFGYLKFDVDYKTLDGFNERDDKNNINIKKWLFNQSTLFKSNKLSDKQKKLLLNIGFIPGVLENKLKIKDICELYDVSYNDHWNILKYMPVNEVSAKFEYLHINNIKPVIEGKLHPIFTTSRKNLEVEYDIKYEDLLNINHYHKEV